MLSDELKAAVKAMAAKYRERTSNIIWAADRFPNVRHHTPKLRVRIKATSHRWHLPDDLSDRQEPG